MSVLHVQNVAGKRIEVRAHGRTRRLLVDGVLHTAWNDGRQLTGAVWDHLVLPTFLVSPEGARSAAVLGVAGGAALRMLSRLTAPEQLVGIDLDVTLLDLARRYFGLADVDAEVVRADARDWLSGLHRGQKFDLVIDDLFAEQDGEPVRPSGLGAAFWKRLASRVAPGGVLVVNFLEEPDLTSSALCQDVRFREQFPAAIHFSCAEYENTVAAFMASPISPRTFRARVMRHPLLANARERKLMRFRVHRLWPR